MTNEQSCCSSSSSGAGMVTHCVCFDVSFETLHTAATRDRLDFDQLQDRFHCGRGCGLCVPYIRLMLRTGAVRFPVDAVNAEPDTNDPPESSPPSPIDGPTPPAV